MSSNLFDLVQRLGQPRVLVIGDVMLDRYLWGDADLISPHERLGGAGSVAAMLRTLGARVMLAGVVGPDHDGGRVRQLLTDLAIDHEAVVTDAGRPTLVQDCYVGKAPQVLRVDDGDRRPIDDAVRRQIELAMLSQLRRADMVLVRDHDRGVCTPALLTSIISGAAALGLRVIAEPIRGHDYRKYHGCSAITPNRREAGLAAGRVVNTFDDALVAATYLRERLDLEAAIVRLDKDGMVLCHRDGRASHFPICQRQVHDGAGDLLIPLLGIALAARTDYDQAIPFAITASGLEAGKLGATTHAREETLRNLIERMRAA
jgi:D-beta-D-heptose 7-phosphate kinase/D-beta-D-heptose 1-phosphate adenosyltransferase